MEKKFKYYGVYISEYQDRNKNNIARVFTNYEEVVKYCKENRKARFKIFCTEEEATEFCTNGSTSGSGNPYCSMESLPFKALKSQDLFQLRKCIETNDYEGVKKMIWKNPRYLISEGDGATILQEGARYNALHICAKYGCASIAELILETVSNNEFIMLLYGSESECSSNVCRTAVLLDSLLNTPDKSLCETALHFAVKYGSVDTVKVFLSYPQCQKDRTNKFHQKPIDIVCSRVPNSNDINVKNIADEIRALLDDGFLIPVWRSPVNDIPPIIGDPFSPPSVPVSPTNDKLLSPIMEITALAGPMSFDDALEFRKKWKTACKINSPSPRRYASSPSPIKYYETTPTAGKQSPQRSYVNLNKSVEHRGRNLAKECNVKWKEKWLFLNTFTDLKTEDGLQAFEDYLRNKFTISKNESPDSLNSVDRQVNGEVESNIDLSNNCKNNNRFLDSLMYICNKIKSLSLSPSKQNHPTDIPSNNSQQLSALQFIECFCMNFSLKLVERIEKCCISGKAVEECVTALLEETEALLQQINSYQSAEKLESFPLETVYSKAGELISNCLRSGTAVTYAQYGSSVFDLITVIKVTENDFKNKFPDFHQRLSADINSVFCTLKSISEQVVKCLAAQDTNLDKSTKDTPCVTENQTPKSVKHGEFTSEALNDASNSDNSTNSELKKPRSGVPRRLNFADDKTEDSGKMDDENELACKIRLKSDYYNCSEDHNDESDNSDGDIFVTPPSSDCESDVEMDDAIEGPDLFITGEHDLSLDIMVYDVLEETDISKSRYPFIYRWRHSTSLYINRIL